MDWCAVDLNRENYVAQAIILYRHPSVSGDNRVCARRCQSVVELQRRLWLWRPILERQTLLQLLHVKALSFKGAVSVSGACELSFLPTAPLSSALLS